MARQRLGQHFLHDAGWRERIARAIRISRHEPEEIAQRANPYCWIEFGAGHGEMTEHLAGTGTTVYAVELDPPLVRRLHELAARFPNVTVLSQDILRTDLAALASGRRIRVYGNLPYYITSPTLHRLFQNAKLIDEIHIVIQLEVALRLVARPRTRDYGYLSVLTQFYSQPSIALQLPPGAFRPAPEVESALVSMALPGLQAQLGSIDDAKFLDFVKRCFAQKRKTLVNNLRGFAHREAMRQSLLELNLGLSVRAEELSVAELASLYGKLGYL